MKNKELNIINEHDLTKKMLDVMRGGLLTENNNEEDVISPSPNDSVYSDEMKKISDTVDPRIQITKFKIYPRDRDVQFEGRLDSGINFFMSIKAMKLSISITDDNGEAARIYLDDPLLRTIDRLNAYYQNWSTDWSEKLNNEYKSK